jgi:hypothetical protein
MLYPGIGRFLRPLRIAAWAVEYRRHPLAEFGLALLLVAVLLLTDRERVDWVTRKLRDFIDWLGTE